MAKITYIEKLKDPRWQRKRLAILNRDDFTCKICNNKEKTLHVHHCGYNYEFSDPWDYPDSWLLTLCSDCHEDETLTLKEAKKEFINLCCSSSFTTDDYYCLFDVINESLSSGLRPCDLMTLVLLSKKLESEASKI